MLIVALVRADTWIERYAEPDKAAHGLGAGEDAWPVPYWWVDGGMAVEHVLLGAVDAGLGACFFGLFDHEPAVFADARRPGGLARPRHHRARPPRARRAGPLGQPAPPHRRRGPPPRRLVTPTVAAGRD